MRENIIQDSPPQNNNIQQQIQLLHRFNLQ